MEDREAADKARSSAAELGKAKVKKEGETAERVAAFQERVLARENESVQKADRQKRQAKGSGTNSHDPGHGGVGDFDDDVRDAPVCPRTFLTSRSHILVTYY